MEKEKTFKKGQKELPRTISKGLHNQILRLRRVGDAEEIASKLGVTAPTISNVFVYGYVKKQGIEEFITNFYEARAESEKLFEKRLKQIKK